MTPLQCAVEKLAQLGDLPADVAPELERLGLREHLDWHGHLAWGPPWCEYFVGEQLYRAHLEGA